MGYLIDRKFLVKQLKKAGLEVDHEAEPKECREGDALPEARLKQKD
jgi:hypothetical protein